MCKRIDCVKCGKPTFAGCGRHVEQVLGDVPRDRRCRCDEARKEGEARSEPASWLRRLFGAL